MMLCAEKFARVLLQKHLKNISIDSVKTRTLSTSITKSIHTSCAMHEFHEYDKRSGYNTNLEIADTRIERIRLGLKQLKKEIKLWKEEMKELIEADPILDYRAGMEY